MSDEKTSSSSWWSTLPGIITALAGLLTAVGGLIAVLNAVGVFHSQSGPPKYDSSRAQAVGADIGAKVSARPNGKPTRREMALETPVPPFGYTHSARFGDFVLDYQAQNGAAEVRKVDSAAIVKAYPSGFATGWSLLASTPNGILFYKSSNGEGALGRIDESGNFATVRIYNAGSFIKGCTSVVGTPNGILFYNKVNGDARIDRIDESGADTILSTYPAGSPGSFAKGWSSIVYSKEGIVYRDDAGNESRGEIESNGRHQTL